MWLKGVFSDSNNIVLWHESEERYKQKKLIPNISVDSNFMFQVMHDYVC